MQGRLYPCALWLVVLLAFTVEAADFPRQINYQGRITDNADMPVMNPAANMEFRLFDAAAGGTQVWNEVTTVDVDNGLFAHDLGSSCGLCQIPDNVLFDDDTLWLEIVFEGETISPRTMLTASPVAYRVASVDKSTGGTITGEVTITGDAPGNQLTVDNSGFGRGGFFSISNGGNTEPAVQGTHVGAGPGGSFFSDGGGPGLRAQATFGNAAELTGNLVTDGDGFFTDGIDTVFEVDAGVNIIRNYGVDGNGENWRLWGNVFGQLYLYDSDASNDLQVDIAAQPTGGLLTLSSDVTTDIVLNGASSGNSSVVLPVGAINSSEIQNESGTANNIGGTILLNGGQSIITSRSINCPTTGYVIAIATGTFDLSHTNGSFDQCEVTLTDQNGVVASKPKAKMLVSGNAPSGNYGTPYAVHGVFSVPSGTTTFYLYGTIATGNLLSAKDNQLSLLFVPTSYGLIVSNSPAADPEDPAMQPYDENNERAETMRLSQTQAEREIAAIQAQLDALKASLATANQAQGSSSNR